MPYSERDLVCRDCGRTFPITVKERESSCSDCYSRERDSHGRSR